MTVGYMTRGKGSATTGNSSVDDRPVEFKPAPLETNFMFDWNDRFAVRTKPTQLDTYSENREWLGANWKILFRQGPQALQSIGVFVGVHDAHLLVPGWHYMISFQFALISTKGGELLSQKCEHLFARPDKTTEFLDQGFVAAFPMLASQKLDDYLFRDMDENGTLHKFYRVRVILERHFQPARIPMNYNCKQSTNMVGLENLGATCYLNALLQMLYHINEFRRCVYQLPMAATDDSAATLSISSSTTLALQSIFRNLQCSDIEVTTKDLTRAFGWTSTEAFMQQDVQEMMRVLLDKLEEKMKGTSVDGTVYKLFGGKVRSYIKCVNVDYESTRDEDFYDIQLDVKGCKNIQDSFKQYIATELLDGDNQYDAGPEHKKQDAEKGVKFMQFPPVLTIHLKRFDFDMQHMCFTKIHDFYEFPLELDLNEYLSKDAEDSVRDVSNVYELHSVLVHAGDVHGGHYYAFIRPSSGYAYGGVEANRAEEDGKDDEEDEDSPAAIAPANEGVGKWYRFNDEQVYEVSKMEAVDNCFGRTSTRKGLQFPSSMSSAYMLVYVRKADSPKVMMPVLDKDIPSMLGSRLGAERQKELQLRHDVMISENFMDISYYLESDVAMFSSYSSVEDFIPKNKCRKLNILKGTTRLGVLLRIARHLNISPFLIRLYPIELREQGRTASGFRLSVDTAGWLCNWKELAHKCTSQHVYVHVVKDEIITQNSIQKYTARFDALEQDDGKWQHTLAHFLATQGRTGLINDAILAGDRNWSQDCGAGMGNTPLDWIRDRHTRDDFKMNVNKLNVEYATLCDDFTLEFLGSYENKRLCFFKVYDPVGAIPLWVDVHSVTAEDVFDAPVATVDNIEAMDSADERLSLFSAKKEELLKCPIKYLGCRYIDPFEESLSVIADTCYQLILTAKSKQTSVNDADSWWSSASNMMIWYFISISVTRPLIRPEIRKNLSTVTIDKFFQSEEMSLRNGDVFCCEPQRTGVNMLQHTIVSMDSVDLTTVSAWQWISFFSQLKGLHVIPYSSEDFAVVNELIGCDAALTGNASDQPSALTEHAIAKKLEAEDSEVAGAEVACMSLVMEDQKANNFSRSIKLEIPMYLYMDVVCELVAKSLAKGICSKRMLLYPYQTGGMIIPVTIGAAARSAYVMEKTLPIPMTSSTTSTLLNELLSIRKAKMKTVGLKYRITPFPTVVTDWRQVQNSQSGLKQEAVEKLSYDAGVRQFELCINDARLRSLRRLYFAVLYPKETRNISIVQSEALRSFDVLTHGVDIGARETAMLHNKHLAGVSPSLTLLDTCVTEGKFNYVPDQFGYSWPVPASPDDVVTSAFLSDKMFYVRGAKESVASTRELMTLARAFVGLPRFNPSSPLAQEHSIHEELCPWLTHGFITSKFTLIVYKFHPGADIFQAFYKDYQVSNFALSWMEASMNDTKLSESLADTNRGKFGVQIFTAEENKLCNAEGNSPSTADTGVGSMGVCVQLSCHGEGSYGKSFDEQYSTDPFVTYVTGQDDVASFINRCAMLSGNVVTECDDIEIQVQHKTQQFRMPTVISCKSAEAQSLDLSSVKIWKYFKETWPEFAMFNADGARAKCKQQNVGVIFPQVRLVLRFGADGEAGPHVPPGTGAGKLHQFGRSTGAIKISG